jgi:hypothetical protein
MPKQKKATGGFKPIEVTVGKTSPPLVREVDFTPKQPQPAVKQTPARPATTKKQED